MGMKMPHCGSHNSDVGWTQHKIVLVQGNNDFFQFGNDFSDIC